MGEFVFIVSHLPRRSRDSSLYSPAGTSFAISCSLISSLFSSSYCGTSIDAILCSDLIIFISLHFRKKNSHIPTLARSVKKISRASFRSPSSRYSPRSLSRPWFFFSSLIYVFVLKNARKEVDKSVVQFFRPIYHYFFSRLSLLLLWRTVLTQHRVYQRVTVLFLFQLFCIHPSKRTSLLTPVKSQTRRFNWIFFIY